VHELAINESRGLRSKICGSCRKKSNIELQNSKLDSKRGTLRPMDSLSTRQKERLVNQFDDILAGKPIKLNPSRSNDQLSLFLNSRKGIMECEVIMDGEFRR